MFDIAENSIKLQYQENWC